MIQETVHGCYFRYHDDILSIGNRFIERKWLLTTKGVFPLSLLDLQINTEWLDQNSLRFNPSYTHTGLNVGTTEFTAYQLVHSFDNEGDPSLTSLKVIISSSCGPVAIKWILRIGANTPLIRQSLFYRAADRFIGIPFSDSPASTPVASEATTHHGVQAPTDYIDYLPLDSLHCRWKAVTLRDVTDTYNNLVSLEEGLLYTNYERIKLSGNFLTVQNTITKDGLLIIKESPTSLAHLQYDGEDYGLAEKRLWVTSSGVAESDLHSGEWVECYGTTVGVFHGSELEQLRLIHSYYNYIKEGPKENERMLMSNTWGDRSRDGRITESFILQELERASTLGITHVQIDDGWQKGITSNSVISGGSWADYYSRDADFWNVHIERFPNGLEPIVQRAKELNIQLGLWFSPDSTQDFQHWQKDLDAMLSLWRNYEICYFKLDGISIKSKLGESRFLNIINEIRKVSSRNVHFNLDTTNGKRQGYLYHTSVGSLFLENRYTDFQSYYPHWTLRNTWMLCPYVPASQLQIEFLNTERNAERYGQDPLSPQSCGIAYSFAITLFTNPLAWMELSGLSESQLEILQPLIRIFHDIKTDISHSHVLPIGEEPSGTGWTGFQSMVNPKEGYLLVFREWTPEHAGSFKLWDCQTTPLTLRCLVRSEGRERLVFPDEEWMLTPSSAGEINISLNQPLSFALYRYTFNL
ncbi:alpha-galactosidase [Paenibacillus luteus]|uniref:alpha-galactosidase n=1 Tax=Paenibacillus luteus TaxID=2545753 RepID=UPI001375687C|nr:alpha-galactosidase [Paenibacillus luteus]